MKKIAALILALSLALGLAACSSPAGSGGESSSPSANDGEKTTYKIGFSQCVMNHPFRIAMVDSVKEAAKAYDDIKLIVVEGDGDVQTEITNIESLIQQGCDAIIVSSLSGTSIYPAYKEVHDAGIPLVIAASGCAQEDEDAYNYYDTFVSTDEVEMGRAAADYANELLNGEGKIVMIRGVVESTNSWPGSWSPVPIFWYWMTWPSPFPAQDSGDWLIFCVPSPRQAALSSTPPIAMKIFSPLQTVFSSSAQALW